jgi:predicted Ser/Thr protein kinase
MTCTSCSRTVPEGSRFCPHCAAPAPAASLDFTRTSAPHGISSSAPSDHGRFIPGTMLGGRYRVVGLLGRGGMGEVYRADDLKLGQAVALKFLPAIVENDAGRLQRFLNEVKIARQISHPNVCRVYDVGEVDGHHYLSMEYVDGEDLASLLRRIGRLPKDKAVEISRQLCVGLAAAHEQGILHRDLKPANVMIDGRGRAKITDFGLATLAGTIRADEVGAGTPQYMAPEQRAGQDVTVRSDIYSLGLVLYELFTGQQAFKASTAAELARLQAESTPTSPTRHVEDLDPSVERAILRCLEKAPRDRPASAIVVAASLPGGDPLAAALAAGETPSPEMVAAAGEAGGLKPWVALALFGVFLVGLLASVFLGGRISVLAKIPMEKPPDALEAEARDILEKVGHTGLRTDDLRGFAWDYDRFEDVKRNGAGSNRWDVFAASRPSPIRFWYRQSPRPLLPWSSQNATAWDPPLTITGMASVWLDPRGRLMGLTIVPPQRDAAPQTPATESAAAAPDWAPLFGMAGLSISKFKPAGSIWNLPFDCDARFAWTGAYDDQPDVPIRVEAGTWRGKPVAFEVVLPSDTPGNQEERPQSAGERAGTVIFFSLFGVVLGFGIFLARRNLRLGRGDRKGALRLASFLFIVYSGASLAKLHHVADWGEVGLLARAAADALFYSGMVWLVYIALEPYVRRLWPELLISWTRLLSGSIRDPRVGRDVLIGGVAGVLLALSAPLQVLLPSWLGRTPAPPTLADLAVLSGVGPAVARLLGSFDLIFPVFLLFLILLARVTLRNQWAALGAIAFLWSTLVVLQSVDILLDLAIFVPIVVVVLYVLMRFGLLAMVGMVFLSINALVSPVSVSSWYAGASLLQPLVVIALAAYAFHISLAGRPLFGGDLLGDAADGRSGGR